MALERVANRVSAGGHSIPAEIVIRRYWAGLRNMFTDYLPLADDASIYDYAGDAPILVAQRGSGAELVIHDADRWELMERTSRCPT
jgi:predicted ABC-type ATPase